MPPRTFHIRLCLGASLAAALWLALPADALAQKRVALSEFPGRRHAQRIQLQVGRLLAGIFDVVPAREVAAAKKRLKLSGPPEQVAPKLAAELGVDGLLEGKIERRRRVFFLLLALRDGATGKIASELELRLGRRLRLNHRARRKLVRWFRPAHKKLGEGAPPDEAAEEEAEENEEEEESADGAAEETEEEAEGEESEETEETTDESEDPYAGEDPYGTEGGEDPFANLSDEDFGVETPQVTEPTVDRLSVAPGVEFATGVVMSRRLVTFDGTSGQEENSFGYESSWNPLARAHLELYPLAWSDPEGALSGLGVIGSYDRTIEQDTEVLDATEQRLYAGLIYRAHVGRSAERPTFKFSAGYLRRKTDVHDPEIDVPDIEYEAGAVGLDVRVPLATSHLALAGSARYLLVVRSGPIGEPESYGEGDAAGLELGAALELRPLRFLLFRFGGSYARHVFDFDGTGMLSQGRIAGARDRYLTGTVSLGFLL